MKTANRATPTPNTALRIPLDLIARSQRFQARHANRTRSAVLIEAIEHGLTVMEEADKCLRQGLDRARDAVVAAARAAGGGRT
jgi:predicted DNA-binding protein